jgi:hypothetical protein
MMDARIGHHSSSSRSVRVGAGSWRGRYLFARPAAMPGYKWRVELSCSMMTVLSAGEEAVVSEETRLTVTATDGRKCYCSTCDAQVVAIASGHAGATGGLSQYCPE